MEQNTKELRQMPEIQSIAVYLRSMEFKKKMFGGCETESVLDHFSAVSLQYEAIISAYLQQCVQQGRQIASMETYLAQLKQENAAYAEYQQTMSHWYNQQNQSVYYPYGAQALYG